MTRSPLIARTVSCFWLLLCLLVGWTTALAAGRPSPVYGVQPLSSAQLRQLTIALELGPGETLSPLQEVDPLLLQALQRLPPLYQQLTCGTALAQVLPVSSREGSTQLPSASDALPSLLTELDLKLTELDEEASLELAQRAWLLLSCLERPIQPQLLERVHLLIGMAHLYAGDELHQTAFLDLVALRNQVGPSQEWPRIVQDAYRAAQSQAVSKRGFSFSPAKHKIPGQVWVDGKVVAGEVSLRPGRHLLQVLPPVVFNLAELPATTSLTFSVVLEPEGPQLAQAIPALECSTEDALAALALVVNEGRLTPAVARTLQLWLRHWGLKDLVFLATPEGTELVLRRFTRQGLLEVLPLAKHRSLLVREAQGSTPELTEGSSGAFDGWVLMGGRAAFYPAGELRCVSDCGMGDQLLEAPASVTPELELLLLQGRGWGLWGASLIARGYMDDSGQHFTGSGALLAGVRRNLGGVWSVASLLELSYGASPLFQVESETVQARLGVTQLRLGGRLLVLGKQVGLPGKLRLGGSLGGAFSLPLTTRTASPVVLDYPSAGPWGISIQPFGNLGLTF